MAPMYGIPNYDFLDEDDSKHEEVFEDKAEAGLTEITVWYLVVLVSLMIIWLLVFFCLRMLTIRQKTRSQQQRRPFTGTRTRTSLSQSEPTIYVSPANLPPPPKYEAMAPPSYEEVVGIHYPQYQFAVQPITQPLTTALAQSSNSRTDNTNAENARASNPSRSEADNAPSTVITVTTDERRTSVTVASS